MAETFGIEYLALEIFCQWSIQDFSFFAGGGRGGGGHGWGVV